MGEQPSIAALMSRYRDAPQPERAEIWAALTAEDQEALLVDFSHFAHQGQLAPPGDWRIWLMLAGRGFGKTRAGAEWVLGHARRNPKLRIALVGGSIDEVARVMVEGDSGIIACAAPGEQLDWSISRSELRFPSGAVAHAFSGCHGDRLRGPQHHLAWADELGKWADPDAAWDNLMMGLRLGPRPRVLITTTPGNVRLLKRIQKLDGVVHSRGRTVDNPHLPAAFIEAMEAAYRNTRLGRQELDGVLLEEADGALWSRELLEQRRSPLPAEAQLARVVVGVDPPARDNGDACGIVVCGRLQDGTGLVLADASVAAEGPRGWAAKVTGAALAWRAERVVAEANNGGQMVAEVLRAVDACLPVKLVHASRGKGARAEPIAALFESGRCALAGHFPQLEDELTALTVAGYTAGGSPDRADAMVWALSELMLGPTGIPRLRGL